MREQKLICSHLNGFPEAVFHQQFLAKPGNGSKPSFMLAMQADSSCVSPCCKVLFSVYVEQILGVIRCGTRVDKYAKSLPLGWSLSDKITFSLECAQLLTGMFYKHYHE